MAVRAMIFDIDAALPVDLNVGRVEESTKWGQLSYATPDTKSTTPIRLGPSKAGDPAIFTHANRPSCAIFATSPRQILNLTAIAPFICKSTIRQNWSNSRH
jgi:hypothetical protein